MHFPVCRWETRRVPVSDAWWSVGRRARYAPFALRGTQSSRIRLRALARLLLVDRDQMLGHFLEGWNVFSTDVISKPTKRTLRAPGACTFRLPIRTDLAKLLGERAVGSSTLLRGRF